MEPFVKWAGGKRQLLSIILPKIPSNYKTYIEPFIGGGALFLNLAPKKAIISDSNNELIDAWEIIKEKPDELIASFKDYKNEEKFFYSIRDIDPTGLSKIERVTRFIYLNKTCYNGLYRVNKKGIFNSPFGYYKKPIFVEEENILQISNYLNKNKKIIILNQDYTHTLLQASKKDFVFLDPPYHPLSNTAKFTYYTKEGFFAKDQEILRDYFKMLDEKGSYCMLTNSNCDFIRKLYKDYNIIEVEANRSVSSKASSRKKEKIELLITNY